MTPAAAPAAPITAAASLDPRIAAFLDPGGPEVFHAIVHQAQLWRADPFDVPTLHEEARDAFERALDRAVADPPPEHGKLLLLLGEAGSGKTHLIRAFRHRGHASGRGYLGYLQMTAQADNYSAYVLGNLIDSLEQPYDEPRVAATGLARLSQALLEALPLVGAGERLQFREGHVELTELPKRVNAYADMTVMDSRFTGCDLDLIRALLYLQRDDPRIKARVLQWLRCEDLAPADREVLGGLVPRCRESDPLRMIVQLGRLFRALHGAALVICVDQLEDMYNQDDAAERLRKVVDSLVAITDQLPSAVVVIACLEDYYAASKQHLSKSKLDRLEHDPPPIRLGSRRTAEEVEALIARRLEYLYDREGAPFDAESATFPFSPKHLARLAGLGARAALLFCQRHQQTCLKMGQWVEPEGEKERNDGPPEPKSPGSGETLDRAWNDFHTAYKVSVPDEEFRLASLLASVIPTCSTELPDDRFLAAEAHGNVVQVESHGPGNAVERFLVAVCNGPMLGNWLLRQIKAVEERAGEVPVVFVRSTDFPANPATVTVKRLFDLIEPKGKGRRAVVQDADWRVLLAFQEFAKVHAQEAGFAEWQRASQPLSKLASLHKILALDRLTKVQPARTKPAVSVSLPIPATAPLAPTRPALPPEPSWQLRLGTSRGLTAAAVGIDPVTLTRHSAFLGGSGSGKTTAALNLVEQLILRGVPAVLVDRKGDLCRYADPAAWTGPGGDSGLVERRRRLHERVDVALYTPGQPAGRPLALPVVPPGLETLPTAEREQLAGYAAGALGAMMAYKPKGPDQSKLAILGKAIEVLAVAGGGVSVPRLRRLVDDRDPALLTAVDGFEDRVYRKLGEDLLTLWLRHRALFEDSTEVLDVDALFGRPAVAPGRTRLSVISTRFLADAAAADFWVTQLLVAFGRWIGKAPSDTLQGVLLLDEADQYLPAVRQPATKGPLENLLRRARSAGLGLMLATQSPADFDYRCRDNIGTWFVGKVKEQRAVEKMRPMLSECRADISGKLAVQGIGEFFLLQGADAASFMSEASLIATSQVPEDRIAELARAGRQGTTKPSPT